MVEKYFLAAIILLSGFFAFWISITPAAVISELVPALLLALFALVVLTRLNSRASGRIMLVYFLAGLLYSAYIYLTTNDAGFLVVAMALLNLVGAVLMVGRHPSASVKKAAPVSSKATKKASAAKASSGKRSRRVRKGGRRKRK